MLDRTGFDRFLAAQAHGVDGVMSALAELASGEKTSHWIWYVLPQIRGLSSSSMGREYGIAGMTEACEYLRNEALRERYLAACLLLRQWTRRDAPALPGGPRPLVRLMGSELDAMKLVSSLTLFERAATNVGDDEIASLAAALLATAKEQGLPRCARTLALIETG